MRMTDCPLQNRWRASLDDDDHVIHLNMISMYDSDFLRPYTRLSRGSVHDAGM